MGKPYDHQYFFSGQGCSCGTMKCAHCGQPIFNHAHDWMAYKKPNNGDWGYVCFHRKCRDDQAGWVKAEAAQAKHAKRMLSIDLDIESICQKHGISREDLAEYANPSEW